MKSFFSRLMYGPQPTNVVKVPVPAGYIAAHGTLVRPYAKPAATAAAENSIGGEPMWLQYLIRALSMVPVIVSGIEQVHGDAKSGAEKKQLAMEALGLAASVAPVIDPAHQQTISAASSLASQAIDGVVAVMNSAKEMPRPSVTAAATSGQ